jgi:hypothetical protein
LNCSAPLHPYLQNTQHHNRKSDLKKNKFSSPLRHRSSLLLSDGEGRHHQPVAISQVERRCEDNQKQPVQMLRQTGAETT